MALVFWLVPACRDTAQINPGWTRASEWRAIKEDEHVVRIISAAMPCQRSVMTPLYRPRALSLPQSVLACSARKSGGRAQSPSSLEVVFFFFFFFVGCFESAALELRERSRRGRWSWALIAGWLNCLAAELFLNGCFSDTACPYDFVPNSC